MNPIKKYFIFVLSLHLLMAGLCSSCKNSARNHLPDVSGMDLPYTSFPFYKDFSALDTTRLETSLAALQQQYPDFLEFYLNQLVNVGVPKEEQKTRQNLVYFLSHKDYRSLFDTVNIVFPDTKKYDKELLQAFRYAAYYDSSMVLPRQVYYFVSGLNLYTAVTHNDTILGIGLDMFLGDYPPYAAVGIPDYALLRFTEENIPVWAMRAVYQNTYPDNTMDKNLLQLLLMKGKEQYFLSHTLPEVPEHIRLGFTPEQLAWCAENEALIYNFFIRQNLLYENNLQKTLRFVNDGPNTAGMPPESPGNIGSYIGSRMLHQYAAKTGADMHTILEITDAQKMLELSRYKP